MKKIKAHIVFFILLMFSCRLYAANPDTTAYINRLLTVMNENIGKDSFNVSTTSLVVNGSNRILTGKATYWNIPGIEYKAIFNISDSLVSLSLVMPSQHHIKLADKLKDFVHTIAPEWDSAFYLPESIKDNLLFDSCSLTFDKEKSLLSSAFLDFKVLGFCTMFEETDLSLSKITVGIEVGKLLEKGKREISGEFAADMDWGPVQD